MCIRDSNGSFVLARTKWFSPLCLVELGETMGISQALQWVAELGFDGIDFSLDFKIMIDAFNGGSKHNSEFGSVI